jgi:hypothetical protein
MDPRIHTSDLNPDPDPAIFVNDFQDGNLTLLFCLQLFEATFTSFFKDKKVIKKHKIGVMEVFLTIFV